MSEQDTHNAIRGGKFVSPELQHCATHGRQCWRYRAETNRMVVVVEFVELDRIVVVTQWRKP